MSFYQLLFSRKINGINRNLTWYWNLFAKYMRENVGTLLAKILKIKGNTIVWNQLARYAVMESVTACGLTCVNNNDGSFTITGTFNNTGDRNFYGFISIVSAIKDHKYLIISSGSMMAGYVFGSATGQRDATKYVVTAGSTGNMETAIRLIDSKANNGQQVNEKIWINIIDLTQLNDPNITDYDSFIKYYPLPYYSYDSGSLLSFNGTGIKTTKADTTDLDTLSLPISTYFPTGMKDVPDYANGGKIYDELTPSKATQRVGEVNLGEQNWSGYHGFFYCNVSGIARVGANVIANIRCPKYQSTTYNNIYNNSVDGICQYAFQDRIAIYDSNISDSTTLKNSLKDVYAYFELAEYVETPISPPLDLSYPIEWGGTEQLLPENTSTPTTSPISATVEYPDGEHEDYYTYQEIEKNHNRLNRALSIMLGRNVLIENPQEPLDILMKGE